VQYYMHALTGWVTTVRKIIAILIGIFAATNAIADLQITNPMQTCNLLIEAGLKTGSWKNHYDQEFGCSSPYKNIGSTSSLPNSLAFYAEGNSTSATMVKLVLNINDPSTASIANKELQKITSILLPKVSGEKIIPPLMEEILMRAISQGENTSMRIGISTVKVVRDNWPTGKGYEIKVIVN
jgi:hypothetical protein